MASSNLRSYPPPLYLNAGKEGMIHLLVGSYVKKPDSVFPLTGRQTIIRVCCLWLAVIFQRDFRPEAGQKTEWCRRSEFLRGRVFFCVMLKPRRTSSIILWRKSVVQVEMFCPFSQQVSWKPQRCWNVSELFTKRKRPLWISSLDSWVAVDLVLDTGAPNDGIFPNASEESEMSHSVLS